MLPSLDVRGKESGKRQEGRVTRQEVTGSRHPCSGLVVRCSGIVVISVLRRRAPKARRETFMTTETSLRKPSRVPKGHLKLVPQPWWSLGAYRPVLGGRLLVSRAGPGSSVRKGIRERPGCPGSCGLPRKCVQTCH
ncbi:hypothetical protein CRG98_015089 [Punica granatum]|uniref:Uncharacterized protein n=1 Tax=Punica granatum TaxID=22663 RepID=A0A2I0K9V4_PUNGR|nr:hypothetical protein CRG98_015089 [Punica granatum]